MTTKQRALWTASAIVGLSLSGVQFGLIIGTWTNEAANTYYWRLASLIQGLAGVIYLVIGLLVSRRRPNISLGWLVMLIGLGILGYGSAAEYATWGLLANPGSLPATGVVAIVSQVSWIVPFALVAILFLVFPTGRLLSPGWRFAAFGAGLAALVVLIGGTASYWPLRDAGAVLITGEIETLPLVDVALNAGVNLLLVSIFFSIVSMVVRWRRADQIVRLQMKWLLLAGAIIVAQGLTIFLDPDGGIVNEVLLLAGLISLPVAVAIAVTRYRLYEIDQIVSRTVSYGLLTILLVGGYFGLIFVLRSLLPLEGQLPVAISTLAVAGLFNPSRRRIQRAVDRRFNRSRYNGERALTDFARRLRQQGDLQTVRTEVTHLLERTVQPDVVSIWVR
jgi:hypothetical protein